MFSLQLSEAQIDIVMIVSGAAAASKCAGFGWIGDGALVAAAAMILVVLRVRF